MTKPTARITTTPDEEILLSNFRVLPPKQQEMIQEFMLRCALTHLVGPEPRKDVIVGHDPVTGNVVVLCVPSATAAKEPGNG